MDEPLVCPVVLPSAMLGSYVRDGEALTASKRETGPKMRYPGPVFGRARRPPKDHRVDRRTVGVP